MILQSALAIVYMPDAMAYTISDYRKKCSKNDWPTAPATVYMSECDGTYTQQIRKNMPK